MGAGVTNIQDDKYPTAASAWLQVSRQGTAIDILNIGLHICSFIYIYIYIYIHIVILYVLKFSFVGIMAFIFSSVNF